MILEAQGPFKIFLQLILGMLFSLLQLMKKVSDSCDLELNPLVKLFKDLNGFFLGPLEKNL